MTSSRSSRTYDRTRQSRQSEDTRDRPFSGRRGSRRSKSHPSPTLDRHRFRLVLVWGILMVAGIGLALDLFYLQVIRSPALQTLARSQQQVDRTPFVPRRPIVDRQGNVLAVDRPAYTLYAHPKLFERSPAEIAGHLAPILDRPVGELVRKLNSAPSGIRLADLLSEDRVKRLQKLEIDGLETVRSAARLYPQQELAAEVVGYVNMDAQGGAGVEYSHQHLLERAISPETGTPPTGENEVKSPPNRPNVFHLDDLRLQLTLDSRLQRAARIALSRQIEAFNAKRGTVMVMDARDGSLLAMVSEPSYDPNQYFEFEPGRFKNWALTDLYEPGSTFKPINVAIALEADAIAPESTVYDEGRIFVDGWPIENADYEYSGVRGSIDIAAVVQYSSNVGMVRVMQRLSPVVYYSWLERLGLGQVTGIDLPFEVPSQIKTQAQFTGSPVEPATTAFGQGFALTPIQLLQLHGTLANEGKLVTPHVVRGLFDTQGQPYWQPDRSEPRSIFSADTARETIAMMERVVEAGTGTTAQIPDYRIAGKTGTAQKATAAGGYSDYAIVTSFVGILPAEDPRYVVLAVVDEPQGGSGAATAAPVVKSVMEALIGIAEIPPSRDRSP